MSIITSPLLLDGTDGYQISRSLRFNGADTAYLNRTPSVAGNRKKWTWAGWVKQTGNSSYCLVYTSDAADDLTTV
jgi:hypothetical protein